MSIGTQFFWHGLMFLLVSLPIVQGQPVPVLDRPDSTGTILGTIDRAQLDQLGGVIHRRTWLEVDPPAEVFGWVEASSVTPEPAGRWKVVTESAWIFPGRPDRSGPGPAWIVVARGEILVALSRPLVEVSGLEGRRRSFRAIRLPEQARGFVRIDLGEPNSKAFPVREESPVRANRNRPRTPASPGSDEPMSPELERNRIRIEYQRIKQSFPLGQWDFDQVERDARLLFDQVSSAELRQRIADDLRRIANDRRLNEVASRFDRALLRSRNRDRQVHSEVQARLKRGNSLALVDPPVSPYTGRLQESRQLLEGRPLQALVGPGGKTTAYLLLPPAISEREYRGKRVTARGRIRSASGLSAPIVEVSEVRLLPEVALRPVVR